MPKLTKNESGIGYVFIIILVVVVLAAAGLIAWKVTKKNSNPSTSSTAATAKTVSNTAVSSACMKAYNDSALCAFAGHTNLSTQSYVATGTAVNSSGVHASFTSQSDGKGDTSVVYSSNGEQLSSISLDGNTYVQSSPGTTWIEYSKNSLGSAAVPNPTSGFDLNLNNSASKQVTVIKDGTTACGDLTCYKYQVEDPSTPDAIEYVLFDTSSHLLREWISNNSSTGEAVSVSFAYQSVNITKPSPVESFSAAD